VEAADIAEETSMLLNSYKMQMMKEKILELVRDG
jgi:hypothetical protein